MIGKIDYNRFFCHRYETMPRPSSYSPPDRRKSIVWRRVTLICEPALSTIQFVGQLTLLYNLWDSFLYHTICGTAQAQAILFYKTISVTLIHCLRAFSLYTISFHVLSILYAYVGMRFVTVIKHSVFAEFTIIEAMCFEQQMFHLFSTSQETAALPHTNEICCEAF